MGTQVRHSSNLSILGRSPLLQLECRHNLYGGLMDRSYYTGRCGLGPWDGHDTIASLPRSHLQLARVVEQVGVLLEI